MSARKLNPAEDPAVAAKASLRGSLHELWLCQLTREYRDICFQYRLDLRQPVLAIGGGTRQLGSWDAGRRVLTLSHFLISRSPWPVTLRLLKHEMAHQICSDLYGCDHAGHGPLFRQACLRIGLEPVFHQASMDLENNLAGAAEALAGEREEDETRRRLIARVQKLLALGRSDNEHEAALALRRAGELLARHRLGLEALAEEEGLRHCTINTGQRTMPRYRLVLCNLLTDFFGVRVVCASLYDPLALCSFKTVELLGRAGEVAIAGHCYTFLEERLATLWRRKRPEFQGHAQAARASYYLGLLAGFRETLVASGIGARDGDKGAAAGPGSAFALTCQEREQRLDEFVAFRFPRLCRRKTRGARLHQRTYAEAVRTGREIILRHPLAGEEGRLIPRLPRNAADCRG